MKWLELGRVCPVTGLLTEQEKVAKGPSMLVS